MIRCDNRLLRIIKPGILLSEIFSRSTLYMSFAQNQIALYSQCIFSNFQLVLSDILGLNGKSTKPPNVAKISSPLERIEFTILE